MILRPPALDRATLFGAPLRAPPKDAENASHRYLVQGGFVQPLASGIFSLLPLGFRVHERILALLRGEMADLGAQEVLLPALQPRAVWEETGRARTMDPPLFTVRDRHDRDFFLAPTHEEVVTALARTHLHSYRQLPAAIFQLQTKFRNELRPSGGLLRTREFVMKDLYSFHASLKDLQSFYAKVRDAYTRIFRACGLKTVSVPASSGAIGGTVSHEFVLPSDAGEDRVAQCAQCGFASKVEVLAPATKNCPHCASPLTEYRAIEVGHLFQLGTKYSAPLRATFATPAGQSAALVMGCYGLGTGRLLAAIVEAAHDERGIRWPAAVAPADAHLLGLGSAAENPAITVAIARTRQLLLDDGFSLLTDARTEATAGEKFAEADLLGLPWRIVVSARHAASETVGLKHRTADREETVPLASLASSLRA